MTNTEQKIEQCKKDVETLQKNLMELEKDNNEKYWVVAANTLSSGKFNRVILNLASFSSDTKQILKAKLAIENPGWISFCEDGQIGFDSTLITVKDGLTFYPNTVKIL